MDKKQTPANSATGRDLPSEQAARLKARDTSLGQMQDALPVSEIGWSTSESTLDLSSESETAPEAPMSSPEPSASPEPDTESGAVALPQAENVTPDLPPLAGSVSAPQQEITASAAAWMGYTGEIPPNQPPSELANKLVEGHFVITDLPSAAGLKALSPGDLAPQSHGQPQPHAQLDVHLQAQVPLQSVLSSTPLGVSGDFLGQVDEDGRQLASGKLKASGAQGAVQWQVDHTAGLYGHIQLASDGHWTYVLNNGSAAVQALIDGQQVNDQFIASVTDSAGRVQQLPISIVIQGGSDNAFISGQNLGQIQEDHSVLGGLLRAGGQLTISDPDAGQDHFTLQNNVVGVYGTFSIDAAGHWTYAADNSQTAIQQLKAGGTLTENFIISSADGTRHSVRVTLTGTNDTPTLTAQSQSVTEDGAQLTGRMVASDVDTGDTQAFSTQNPPAGFTLNADGSYSFDPADAAYQHLAAGQTQTLTIPITVTDSSGTTSTQNLSITITGSNDGAIIGGRVANNVTEDSVVSTGGMLRAGGQLTVVDPDAGEAIFVAQTGVTGSGHYGSFSIDASGHYSYTADNTQNAIQRLKAGDTLTDRFTVATADGTQQVVTITINGAEDRPVLHAQTHAVTEDGARLTGQMLATDVDAGDTQRFSVAHPVAGFVLNPDGSFSFNPATASYQHLAAGQTQDVVIPVTVIDSAGGTSTQNLTITVTGKNDGATISGVNTGSTAEDNGQAVTGQLTVADVDDGQAHFVAQSGSAGTYGTFSLNEQGQWSYALDNSKASVQALKTGDSVTDSFTVTSADGTTHQVTVTVTGKDDGALIGGADTASVTEDVSVTAGKLEAQGQLTITDPDAGQNHFTAQSNVAGTYGTFSIDQAGHWTYTVNNSQGVVQQLKTGDSLIDSMTIASADGTTHTLLVAIQGSNDAPILTAQAQSVTEDGARLTGNMVATDVDQGDTQFFSTQNPPAGFTLNPDGSYSFDPADSAYQHLGLGQPLVISIPITVTDSAGLTSSKNLVITITGSNDAPQLATTPVKILEGAAPIQGQLTATDPDTGDTLTYRANGPVAGFTLNPDGSFSFDPAHAAYNTLGAGQERVVSIPVTVVDGHGGSTTQNLDITVTGTNDGPAITAIPQTVKEGDALLKGQLIGTDADSGDTLTYSTTAKPDGFTLNADGCYTFDPAHAAYDDIGLGQTRVLTIPMTVSDGHGGTATQSLQITVIGTNDAPVMVAEPARTTTEDSAILHGQLAATDPDHADTLTYRATATVPGFLINPDGSYTFNPGQGAYNHLAAGQTQVLSIPVEVTDGHGGTGTQTLQISITGADDGPSFVIAGTRSATEGGPVLTGQLTATDPDSGDTLTYASGAQVAGFALNADGSYSFDPSHADYDSLGVGHSKTVSVLITVTDSQGQSVTQTLRITIAGSNDNPTVSAVAPSTVAEDSAVLQGRLTIADVDAGDTLTCRTSATVAGFNLNPNGSYTFDPGNHTYDHLAPGDSEVLSIPVTVSDGHGGSATQTLQITITGSNDGPALTVVDQTVREGAAVLRGQFAGTDPDRGDTLTYSTSATVAGFTLNADGSYSFDAAHAAYNSLGVGHSQVVSIPVTVTDSQGATATRSLQITVEGTDDAPVLTATPRSVNEGDASIQGRLTATDPDVGDSLTYSTTATIAGFRLTPDGSYTFDPSNAAYNSLAAGTSQDVTIPVTVSDGHGGTTTQNLVITVAGVNDAAHISGARTGTVTEDIGAPAGKITTTGTLTVTDPDVGQDHFVAQTAITGTYGSFSIDAQGHWTYTADNTQAAIQALKQGVTLTDALTVHSADGTSQTITVNILGTNDAPTLTAQSQSVTEDGARLTGKMVATDVDQSDTQAFSTQNPPAGFTLNADGSYSFDPADAAYQYLAAGQTQILNIPITVTDSAGATSTQNLSITITGSNDTAVVSGRVANSVTEDGVVSTAGMLRAGGQLTVIDPDAGEAVFVAQTGVSGAGPGHYGSFSIDASGHYSYTADNTQNAIQQLKAGETLTDRFTVATADGTQQVVTITINGAEDKPVLQAQTHAVTEDGARLTGQMLATDVDAGDTQRFSVAHPVAGFVLNPDGSFSFNPATASYQHLAAGQTQDVVIPITVIDSAGGTSTQNLTITVTGTNDGAVIAGTNTGTVTEDSAVQSDQLQASGQLTITDADTGEAHFTAQTNAAGIYGSFSLDATGAWTYTADNTQTAVQQLKVGDSLTDTLTVTSADGTSHTVTVTLQGTNDAPLLAAQTQAVTEDGTLLQGRMVATDVDAHDTQTFSIAQPVDGFTLNTDGSYSFDPSHASYQHLAAGQTQDVVIPVTVTDSAGATATQNLTIRLTGTNDAPHISGADVGRVVEDQTLSVNGQLQISDADDGQAHFVAQTATAGSYGSLTLSEDGLWQYQLDNSKPEVQALKSTETATDTFTVHSADGSSHSITITIQGQRDNVVIGGVDVGVVKEDVSAVTGGHLVATGESAEFVPLQQRTTLGDFSMDADGAWTYTLDNSRIGTQALKAGETATETVTITHTDGSTHSITISVMGTNDAPVLSAQTQAVTEDGTQLTGHLVATDADHGDTQTFSHANTVDGFTLNADGSYSFDPSHASYQHLAAGQTQDLVIPITVTDSTGLSSTQNLTITLTGSNDGATIAGTDSGAVTEDSHITSGKISTSGTLTVIDPDAGQDHFNALISNGHYGVFTLDAAGQWTYSADNSKPEIQHLKAGDTLTDSFTVTSADGTAHTVTVIVAGTNDAPVLAAQTQAVTEDGAQLQGHMVATDVDASDTQVFSTAQVIDGFTLNADGSYSFDPANAAYQHLATGQTQNLVIPITVTDSVGATSTQNLTITITGANDGAVISGVATGTVTEDLTLSVSGQLAITDADDGQAHFVAQTATAGSYGSLTLSEDGHWQYQLDNSKPEVQALKSTETATDTFTVHSADGSSHSITVTIQGQRDSVVIGGVDVGVVKEDVSAVTGGHLVATGESAEFVPVSSLRTTLGEFSMDADGAWSYTLDNSATTAQALKDGETTTDNVSITHTDGTTHTITITVMGTNDAPVLAAQTQAVTEDGSQLSGHMVAADVDAGETQSFSIASAVDGFTLNADGSYQFDPTHTSYQHLAAGQTQDVVIPVTVTDSAGATSTQNLTITVTGTNDTAVIGGRIANFVTEDGVVSTAGMLRAGGQLTVVDPDAGEAVFVAQTGVSGAGHYGSFSIDSSGHYSYIADNTQNAIQQLKAGETLTDRFTVATAGGTQQVVTITIKGAEDKPVLQAQSQAVTEDGSLLRGQMVATDVDAGDTQRFSVAHPVAGFVLNPDGSYTFNPAHAAYQHLAAGQTQDVVIPITVIDSGGGTSTENLTITVAGTNDAPDIRSTRASARMVYVDAPSISITGQLHVRDTDDGDTQTWSVSGGGQGHFGHLDFDAQTGRWTYQLDKSDADTQALKAGEQAQEAFQITVTDGSGASSSTVVRVMVVGTNDAPILTAQSQTVTEDGAQLNGHMVATDVDAGDTQSFSIANAVDGFTLNADGSYSFDPSNAAYQHLAAGQTEDLVIPVTVTDSAGASHTQNLTITITGTNDGALIGGAFTGAVTEDQYVQSGQLQASGQLTITDADSGESHFIPQTDVLGSDGLGRFSLDAQGHWSYSADNSQKAIQQLGVGATLNDSFTVQGADGALHTVTVTLTGSNDAPQFHLQVAPDYNPEVESSDVLPLVINNIGSSRIAQYLDIQQILQGQAPIGAYANTCVTVSLGGLALIGPDGQAAQVFAPGQEFKLQTLVDWQQQGPGHEFRVFGPKGTVGLDISFHDAGDPNHITGPQGQASLYVNQVSIWPPFHAWQASASTGTASDSGLLTATEGGPALSGQFHASDIDVGDTLAFSLGHPVDGFTLNADGSYSFDPAHPSYQHLAAGQSETLSIPITVTDSAGASTTQTLSILLRGANDAATFGGVETGATQEDRPDALSGQLTVADADDGEAHFIAQSGTAGSYGQFSLDENGQWHYQIDNSKPEVQALRDGQNVTDSFTVRSADGTAHTVNISIAGKNDSAVITGEDHQTLTEDQNVSGGQLIAHGQLHASTPDAGGDQFTPLSDLAGKFGHLSLSADGSWVYKADNSSPAVQALHGGQSATESFTVHSVDGTAHTLSLSIQGADEVRHDIWSSIVSTIKSNWAPYNLIGHAIDAGDVGALGSMRLAFTSGNPSVVDANGHVLASGSSLGAFGHDISMGQVLDLLKNHPGAQLVLDGNVGGSSGFYLHDSGNVMELHFRGLSHYNQANNPMGQVPIDGLPTPLSAAATLPDVSDSLTISVTDISVDHAGQLQTSGQLSISDADAGENHFNAQKDVAGTYGSFSIDASGHWVYSVDNGQAAVQNLQAGAQLTDSFMVTSADGSSHVVSVAVYGKNDAPVLFAQSQSVSEDGAQLSGQMHASDVDAGDTLSFRIDQAVAGFSLNADGSYSFDPSNTAYQHLAAGQTETLVIPVFVTDHMGASSVQDLTITLTGANDGPKVLHATAATAGDLGAVNEDTPRVFTEAELLQAVGATDPDDGGSLHIVAGSLTSAHGSFTGDAAHGFTFTPAANFSGQDIDLQFNVTDGSATREAHAQLDITPVADAPLRVTAPTITTDFDSISLPGAGWTQTDPTPIGWHTDESAGLEFGQERLYGGSGNNQILSLTASWGSNIYRELPTQAGEAVHLGFDLSARPGFAVTPLEVLWEGKVIDTITPVAGSYSMQHHDYDLLATGSNSRLELRASGRDEARVLIDNLQIGPPEHVVLGDHDTLLKPYLGFHLADTDGSETLSYGVHGLPVGFTLTDGTHSAIVSSAGQVIETAGWNQDTLAVRAPQGFQGDVSIQVTAHAEEGSTHQTANAADLTLALRLVPVSHAAVISGENSITLTEDEHVNSSNNLEHFGQLNVSDPDAGEAKFVAQNAVNTQYGRYTIGGDGYWLYEADNKLPAIQQLKTGESLSDSFTVHSIDGTPQTITVTIQGQDDAPTFVPQTQAARVDSPDVYMQIGVQLLSSEHREFQFMGEVLLANTDPRNYIDAEMSFTNTGVALRAPDGSLSKVYHAEGGMTTVPMMDLRGWHNQGQGYDVVLVDATGMPINVFPHDAGDPDKMSGFNQYVTGFSGPFNAAVVLYPDIQAASSAVVPAMAPVLYDAAHVLEDNGQQISGFIEVQDADQGQSSMQPMTVHHAAHGTFSIDINGDWVYQLDSSRPDVQALKDGETLLETITVHSADGTPHTVNITIHGQSDGAVISGADTGRVIEDQQVAAAGRIETHGQLTVSDVDAGEAVFVAQNAVATKFGHFSIDASGAWRYEVDNNKAEVQALKPGGTPGETGHVFHALAEALSQSTQPGFHAVGEALSRGTTDGVEGALDLSIQGAAIVLSGPAGTTPVVYAMDAQGRSTIGVDELLSWMHQGMGYEVHLQGTQTDVQAFVHDRGDAARLHGLPLSGVAELNDPASAAQHLALQWHTAPVPGELSEVVSVASADGTTHQITLNIQGTAEDAVITGVDTGSVTEDAHVTGAGLIEAHGQLAIQDPDKGQAAFAPLHELAGQYGHLSLEASGLWTYTADNNSAALNGLSKNQSAVETFVVKSVDGTAHTINVTVNGADEKPDLWPEISRTLMAQGGWDTRGYQVIAQRMAAGDSAGLRDVVMNVFDGKPTVVDAAGHVLHTFDQGTKFFGYRVPMDELCQQLKAHPGAMLVMQGSVGGSAGYFFHNAGDEGMLRFEGAYMNQPANHLLGSVPINGLPQANAGGAAHGNAAAQLGGADSGSVLADGDAQLQTQGHMTVLDADGGQAHFTAQHGVHGHYGQFSIDAQGSWHYQADGHQGVLQQLAAGQALSDSFSVTSADGSSHTVTVQLFGSRVATAAVISGVDSGSVVEDAAQAVVGGQLSIVDPDPGEAHFIAQADVPAQHGHFSLQDNGAWTYTLDNKSATVQALKAGESFTEHLTVSSVDGSTHVLTVTVQGSNDTPMLQAQSQSVTEDGSLLRGQMAAQDVDHGDALHFSTPNAVGGFTLNADGSYSFDPSHHDYQSLTAGQVRDIDIPITVTDSAGATATQLLSIHITGRNDSTFIYGVDSGQVQAGVHPQTSGDLHASDDDVGQSGFQAGTVKGSFGSLSIDAQGHWTYQVDGHDSFVQHLLPNSHITEQLTVHSVDGTAHDIEVEVSGPPGGSQLSDPADSVNVQHVALPQVWDAYQAQTGASQGGHDVFAGIQDAVRTAGYQYQGLADELDKGSLATFANLDISITGVRVQVIDAAGHLVQNLSPTAENAATLHMSDVLDWHAQGHSIIATSESGLDTARMWLHNTGDMHNIQVILPDGTGFNGWVGEYTFGELSLNAPQPSPAPPSNGAAYEQPFDFAEDHFNTSLEVVSVETANHESLDSSDRTEHASHSEAWRIEQNDLAQTSVALTTEPGQPQLTNDHPSPVQDYLHFADMSMSTAGASQVPESFSAAQDYLALAGVHSSETLPAADLLPPTDVLIDIHRTEIADSHATFTQDSADLQLDSSEIGPVSDDENHHHGGI
ncbi:VCBS domain-containing protein [Aquipseudomonas alcaligenes]|uniref:VCBS repeat-containing protein n=1 Tax=Aquipseudomonas alcaligenes TaxID=43263 RepID=A0A1N6WA46_AQUAC|nr:VCBS domain-containing protein [Pseudomonas alcaligenes]SIQ87019.1 VCBS repeat-containing protein [Pseudomonas alcaligenes]